jgi:hypothetical protein
MSHVRQRVSAQDAQRAARPTLLEQQQAVGHALAARVGHPRAQSSMGSHGEIHLPGERDAPVEDGPGPSRCP